MENDGEGRKLNTEEERLVDREKKRNEHKQIRRRKGKGRNQSKKRSVS
jgi:hypothetical protein